MATIANEYRVRGGDTRFFFVMAIVMAALNFLAFSVFAFAGISSFHAPAYVHAHAILFMGWVVLFATQASLAAGRQVVIHRTLGWVAVGWALAMVVVGTTTTVWTTQRGGVPFFFLPAQFLVMNPFSVVLFAALVTAGFVHRRDRDWHPRLIVSAMAAIMGPSLGRALPAPLLMYHTLTAVFIGMLAFPVAGMVHDRRRRGRVHPAWIVGFCAIAGMHLLVETVGRSSLAAAIYERVVAGTPGAAIAPLTFQPPPFAAKP